MNMPTDILTSLAGQKIDRRGFLTFAAKGLAVAFVLPAAGHIGDANAATMADLNAYVHIGTDGSITLSFGGAEMGQGTMSGLSQILAEELMVDWTQITVDQALVFNGVSNGVSYSTGGSSGVSRRYTPLRNAGAAARELLIKAAMVATGDTNRSNYFAESGNVVYTGGTTDVAWAYAGLATIAATQTVPAVLPLTAPANFRLIGTALPRVDIPSKVDGSAKYGIDIWFSDMVFAAIKHCPTIGGTVAKVPAKPAAAIAVVPCTAVETRGNVLAGSTNAVAVVASNTWLAFKLANSLSVTWMLPTKTNDVDSAGIMTLAQSLLATGSALLAEPAPPATTPPSPPYPATPYEDSVTAALAASAPVVDRTYTLPYVAHATMEVLNCTVRPTYTGGVLTRCEIWAPTQSATTVAVNAGKLMPSLPASAIVVHTTYLGGGLGRKIEQDYIWQAIQVALVVQKPVKLTWRREEDFAHDQYRPMALARIRATLSGSAVKTINAWSYRTVSQSISAQRGRLATGFVDSQAVEGAVRLPYNLGNHLVEWVPMTAGIPVGYWRSVGASINAFAVECMIDELALAAGRDPFQFRYDHLAGSPDPRWYDVLAKADAMSSAWRNALPAGHAWGVAIAEAFGTVVCEVVEVSQPVAGSLRVHRVDCVVNCGTPINPGSIEAQMQGGILHALNATLWGQSTFTAGKANQQNFNKYRVMRISEMPQVNVQIISSPNPPTGVGEPGVPPLAPAIANAHARLPGAVRVRSLPFFPNATMGGI